MNAKKNHLSLSLALAGIAGMPSSFRFAPDGAVAAAGQADADKSAKAPAEPYKALREEHTRLFSEASGVIDGAAKEGRELKEEEKTANEKRFTRIKQIKGLLDDKAKLAGMAFSGEAENVTVQTAKNPPGEEEHNKFTSIIVGETKLDKLEFTKAVRNWSMTGVMDKRFATITTATASSILLPKTVVSPLVTGALNTFREGFAAWGFPVFSTPGDTSTFNLPVVDPTAGGQVAENASSETENAPSLSESIVSTVKTYQSGSVYYSGLQLSATGFDLLAATVPHLQFNKELGLESTIAAAIIADSNITQTVATATTSGFTFANSVALANKLPKRYQSLKVRLLSAAAYTAAEGLTDDQGRPIMVMDTQNQTLKKMHGTPTFRCDYLEAFGASKIVGLEFSLVGFHLRDAGEGIARYDQVPAKPNQTGINLFGYHAYGYAVSAMALLKCPAS